MTMPGYGQTTFFKVAECTNGFVSSAAAGGIVLSSILGWESTAAVSRIKVAVLGGPNLIAGSRLLICAT